VRMPRFRVFTVQTPFTLLRNGEWDLWEWVVPCTVRADGLQVINSLEDDTMVIKKWTNLACRKLRIE